MREMTPEERREFLIGHPRTGKLATTRADGRPHVVPVWFDLDGEAPVFTTWHESLKAKHIRRDARVALCVDDETPPFAFVVVEGTAEIIADADLVAWATRIAGRYMGPDLAEAYGRRNGVEGELLIRVNPTAVIARAGIAD